VSFMVFMATTYQRFRHMESTLTKLSRRIALDETPPPDRDGNLESKEAETDRRLTPPAHGGQ